MREALPLMWRNIHERYNLVGCVCEKCGTHYFPERKFCPKCRRQGKLKQERMPHDGVIVSFTEVHAAPKGFEHETPFHLAIIELSNGARLLAQVADSPKEKIAFGAKVTMVFRRIFEDSHEGAIAYGYKFKVVS